MDSDIRGDYMDLVTLAIAKKYVRDKIAEAAVGGIDIEDYVTEKIAGVIDSAPEALNTLNELAAALGDDPNFAATIATQIGGKADKSALGTLAGKSTVAKSDLATAVQTSLGKADTALQSFTETDPTVPAWAKEENKPTYTADEVGALPNTTVIPTTLAGLAEDATHRVVTDTEKTAWNAKSNFSGSYNDLTNKPTIPSVVGLASETYVDNAVANAMILNSTTEGSTKRFRVTVDDSGTLTAVEITE